MKHVKRRYIGNVQGGKLVEILEKLRIIKIVDRDTIKGPKLVVKILEFITRTT